MNRPKLPWKVAIVQIMPQKGQKQPKMTQKRPIVSQMVKNSPIWSNLVYEHEKEVFVEQPCLHRDRLTSYRVSGKKPSSKENNILH